MKSPRFRRILLAIVVIIILGLIYPAIRYYDYYMSHVSTDDAYVDGTVGMVASRIPGTVLKIYVAENWNVKGGQLLLSLDPSTYEARVDQVQAQVNRAKQTVNQLFAQLDAARAGQRLAESQLNQARIDYNRAKQLRQQKVVSSEYFDQATTALRVAMADNALAQHQVQQARAALGGDSDDSSRYARPIVQQSSAQLEAAKLNLSYTQIRAPFTGVVTHKSVYVGDRVQTGQPLMAIVPEQNLYITANYKETELTDVRVGQHASIWADIYPGYVYHGHVDSIAMGTGAAFALLPPENATGNWVKVVQRVPVKIVLNSPAPPDKPLRIGLSVEVAVDISNKSGPLLTSTLQQKFNRNTEGEQPWRSLQYPVKPPGKLPQSTPSQPGQRSLFPVHP
ncbi:MAG: efflux RND transporter periplasmic adaptor subunit [Candidatus Binataceae bacterium]